MLQSTYLRNVITVVSLLVVLCSEATEPQPLKVVIPPPEDTAKNVTLYFEHLVRLALRKTEATDGPFTLEVYPTLFNNSRFISELKRKGAVNLMWAVSDASLEQELLPIRVPIMKDINSYRIFLILPKNQTKFSKVTSLAALRQYRAGSGARWADTDILLFNEIPVVTSPQFEPLFGMLSAGRFDYFPRGVDEIWNEQRMHKDKHFAIEQTLLLHYPAPKYFFVNKDDRVLAERLERGLKLAMADGSFDRLFFSVPDFKRGLAEINNKKRRLIELAKPSPVLGKASTN